MHRIVLYVQQNSFGSVLEMLKNASPDSFEDIVKQSVANAEDNTVKKSNEALTVITKSSSLYAFRWIISSGRTNWKS